MKIILLLTWVHKRCNSELAKDVSRWRQHLRFLCILIWAFICVNISLHFQWVRRTFWVCLWWVFNIFYHLIIRQKILLEKFLFFSSFKSWLFSEENAYFIKTCQKQTRQVIKICPNDCLDQGVKKTCIVMLITSSCPNLVKVNLYTSRNSSPCSESINLSFESVKIPS